MDQDQMMLDYLMEMGALQPEQEAIMRQREMANQLRQGAQMPGMRQTGRVAVAANPLEFLSSVGSGYGAIKQDQQADAAAKAYKDKRMGALEGLRGRMSPQRQTGIVPPAGGGSPYGDDPYAVKGW